jgi:hypothetical protein
MKTPKKISQAIYNIWQIINKHGDNSSLIHGNIKNLKNIELVEQIEIQHLALELSKLFIDEIKLESKKANDEIGFCIQYVEKIKSELSEDRSFKKGYYFTNELTLNECLELNFSGLGNVTPFEFLHGATKKIVMQYLESRIKEIEYDNNKIEIFRKIRWHGKDYQFYDIVKQLKNKSNKNGEPLLPDSYKQIANFLFHIVEPFNEKSIDEIVEKLSSKKENINNEIIPIKLNWLGNNNQLYDIFRQLKLKELISNSYTELADILNRYVPQLEKTSLSTIGKQIGKDKRPSKKNRIDLHIIP